MSSSTLGSLVVQVEANVARFQSDMGKVAGIAETAVKRVEETSTIAANALKSVGAIVAGAFAVGALKSFAAATIESIAQLKDLSEQTGASVQNLSALRAVARLGGQDFDAIATAMGKLTKGLSGSDEETKGAARAIQDLGLNLEKFKQLDPAQQFKAIADKLIGFKDNANKAALAYDAFGKTGASILPFLKDLAEQGELVGKVTKDQAEQADQYEKNLRALSATSDKLKKDLVVGMLPALADITSAMRTAAKESGTLSALWVGLGGLFAKSTIGQAIDAEGNDKLRRDTEDRIIQMKRLSDAIETNERLAKEGQAGAAERAIGQRAQLEALIALQAKSSEALKGQVAKASEKEPEKPSLPERPKTTTPTAKSPGESFIEQLQRQIQQQTKGREEMLRLEAAQKNVSKAAAPYIRQLEEIEARAQRIAKDVEEAAKAEDQRARVVGLVNAGNDVTKSIVDQTEALGMNEDALRRLTELRKIDEAVQRESVDATSETRQELEKIADVMRKNVIAALDAADEKQKALNGSWQFGATQAIEEYAKKAQDTASQVRDALTNAFQSAEDTLVKFVQTGKLNFKSLADSIIADLLRIEARRAITAAIGSLSGVVGTIGSFLSGSFDENYSHEGRHANGLAYVPHDNYRAILHEGERVMTKQENQQGSSRGGVIDASTRIGSVGAGVSRGEMKAAIAQANAQQEARIRRLNRQGVL